MLYFDTSFLTPLILEEPTSGGIETFFANLTGEVLCVSHWTRVEFCSLMGREVRMGGFTGADALIIIREFDELVADSYQVLLPSAADYEVAKGYIQDFATKLRAGDALHLAIAHNNGAEALYTLDEGLLNAAKLLRIPASRGIKISQSR